MNVVACPSCSQQLQYNPQQAGQQVQCPHCQSAMILPGAHHPMPPANPTPPVNPMMGAPMQTHPLQPGLYGQQNVSSPAQNRNAKKKKTWTQKLAGLLSDRKAQQKFFRSKGFVAGTSSLGGLVIIIVIINFTLGVANHISRKLSSDIPIPSFLAAVEDPEDGAMTAILYMDEKDKFGFFRVTDKDKIEDNVMRWFNKELKKRDWEFVSQGGHSRVWRQGNRRLFVGARYANKRITVTIIESPDYPWKD